MGQAARRGGRSVRPVFAELAVTHRAARGGAPRRWRRRAAGAPGGVDVTATRVQGASTRRRRSDSDGGLEWRLRAERTSPRLIRTRSTRVRLSTSPTRLAPRFIMPASTSGGGDRATMAIGARLTRLRSLAPCIIRSYTASRTSSWQCSMATPSCGHAASSQRPQHRIAQARELHPRAACGRDGGSGGEASGQAKTARGPRQRGHSAAGAVGAGRARASPTG